METAGFLLISKPLIIPPMKKITLFLFVALFIAKTYAQAEPANYVTAIAKFKQYYNNNHVDSIFNMFSPEMKNVLPLQTFKPTTNQLRQQFGELLTTEFVSYSGSIAVYKATFKGSIFLLNIALSDRNKLNGLFLSPYRGETAAPAEAADPDVTETPVVQKTLSGQISGTLAMPSTVTGKIPVVLIIGDAGPTDRDGNNEKTGITCSPYKTLAHDLAKNGIASLRYDKRLVGESTTVTKESQLRIDDYSDDAVTLIGTLNDDPRFSKIVLFGHGEGAEVCMIAWIDQPIKGYISAEGASEQADKIIMDQMKSKPQYQADEVKTVLDSLRKGKLTPNVDPAIYYIAGPSKQNFLMSWCRLVPTRGIKSIKVATLIIQGTTDLAIPTENGDKLKKAKSDATYLEIKGMNHIFKDAPADPDQNAATYTKNDVPLSTALVPGIVAFVNKLK
jgi:pimeloyl-ACP methyl ester carboxylesterase